MDGASYGFWHCKHSRPVCWLNRAPRRRP
jgi:hypothetical protein